MTDAQLPLAEAKKPLKIISFQAENIKRLVAVRIDPKGNLVQITGKNMQGKSSVLDAIWWAIGGANNIQKSPIRNGQEKARIKLDMGEVVVTRSFRKMDDGSFTTGIVVEDGEGARHPKPQMVLDAIYGELTFDPLEFARSKPKDKFDTLKRFVPGIDFDKIAGLNLADFQKRADINRQAKEKAGQVAGIAIPEAVPAEKVDEAALVTEIGEVGAFNAQIERRQEGREKAAQDIVDARAAATKNRDSALALRKQADALDTAADELSTRAGELQEKLDSADALPEPKSAAEVQARLGAAKRTNALVDQAARRVALQAEADALIKQSEALTAAMAAREEDKRKAIAAAKLPVDGIEFAEDDVLLNGVPFEQASDAEQLRASLAIAMASNPRLRVIRVRDGSLLDEDGLRIIDEMATDRDFQVWVEQVDSSGKVGFALKDGHVASTPETRAQAQAAE